MYVSIYLKITCIIVCIYTCMSFPGTYMLKKKKTGFFLLWESEFWFTRGKQRFYLLQSSKMVNFVNIKTGICCKISY